MLKLSHGLIANSHRAKDNLVSLGIETQKIAVQPNVIDLCDFDHKAAKPLVKSGLANRILITAVGSLHECKRFDRFLDGLAVARQRQPNLFGVIAGTDVGEKAALERKARRLGLIPGHLEFLGECEHIPSLLAHSRLLISCSDYEGFPNVILEAMAARLPVLATPVGDVEQIVKDGATGFLLKPDDAQGMADRIVHLINDPAFSTQMGQAGRKRVEQDYNVASLAPRLMSIFSEFAGKYGKKSILGLLQRRPPVASSSPQVSTHGLPVSVA